MQFRRGEGEKPAQANQALSATMGNAARVGVDHRGPGGLLDYEAAARYLGTTPRHVRELWAKRYLAGVKVGRRVRFRIADLDAFIAAHRVPAVR
jgi:excisionase family DNA binding protein